jgi:hypothetical protein
MIGLESTSIHRGSVFLTDAYLFPGMVEPGSIVARVPVDGSGGVVGEITWGLDL